MSLYQSFAELSLEKIEGVDYTIQVSDLGTPLAVVAPHGGGIEPGTAEIALALAGGRHSCYIFDGLRENSNHGMHLTSTHFDEPACLDLVQRAQIVLAIHGCDGREEVVHIGGRHTALGQRFVQAFSEAGFAPLPGDGRYAGRSDKNICNQGSLGQGVQLEISLGLRRKMFKGLSRAARAETTPAFDQFISAVQAIIDEL